MPRTPLISATEMADRLDGPSADRPTVLDVRWELGAGAQPKAYRQGHIPGAAFVDLDRELAGPPGPGGRHPLPGADAFTRDMRAKGVDDARTVVAYDSGPGLAAARCWWLLRYFGHADVAVLDGGLESWLRNGGPLQAGDPPRTGQGDFGARAGAMELLDAGGALQLARRGLLLDARALPRRA